MSGGPIGFSSDLAALPEGYKEFWKTAIEEYKLDRDIYANGSARILADGDGFVALEYSDELFEKCIVQLFTTRCFATDAVIYPVVDESAEYSLNGESISGRKIKENGILLSGICENDCKIIRFEKKVKKNEG